MIYNQRAEYEQAKQQDFIKQKEREVTEKQKAEEKEKDEEMKKEKEEAQNRRMEEGIMSLPEEPAEGGDNVTTISFRSADGSQNF